MFVGYPVGYNGYKLFNLEIRQFSISRDIKFCESLFPFHKTSTVEPLLDLFRDVVLPILQPDLPNPNQLEPQPTGFPTGSTPPPPHSAKTIHVDFAAPLAIVALRRSSRVSKPPSYLNDYQLSITSKPYSITIIFPITGLVLPIEHLSRKFPLNMSLPFIIRWLCFLISNRLCLRNFEQWRIITHGQWCFCLRVNTA